MGSSVRGSCGDNWVTTTATSPAVFTVDAPCLPGMEGGLVLAAGSECGGGGGCASPCVVGLLALPLSRTSDGVQIHVAISWPHVAAALHQTTPAVCTTHPPHSVSTSLPATLGHIDTPPAAAGIPSGTQRVPTAGVPMSRPVAVPGWLRGVVLVRTQHSWGTGVVVTPGGLVITNAHLLLPGATGQKERAAIRSEVSRWTAARLPSGGREGVGGTEAAGVVRHCCAGPSGAAVCAPSAHVSSGGSGGSQSRRRFSSSFSRYASDYKDAAAAGVAAGRPGSEGGGVVRRHTSATCMVRMASPGSHARWCAAHILYIFTNHLDLAVLQLAVPGLESGGVGGGGGGGICGSAGGVEVRAPASTAASASSTASSLPHIQLPPHSSEHGTSVSKQGMQGGPVVGAQSCVHASMPAAPRVFVVGHGLVGPAAGWPAAVTAGNVAQVCDCVSTFLLLS